MMDSRTESDDEDFLRSVTLPFEELRWMVRHPYSPGQHRWFRSANVVDLMLYRRRRGIREWTEHKPWEGITAESLRMPATPPKGLQQVWPANVIVLASWRRQKGV
jgi:hypothetical protein